MWFSRSQEALPPDLPHPEICRVFTIQSCGDWGFVGGGRPWVPPRKSGILLPDPQRTMYPPYPHTLPIHPLLRI